LKWGAPLSEDALLHFQPEFISVTALSRGKKGTASAISRYLIAAGLAATATATKFYKRSDLAALTHITDERSLADHLIKASQQRTASSTKRVG
jgi:hypothetical protein